MWSDNSLVLEVGAILAATSDALEVRLQSLNILGPEQLLLLAKGYIAQEQVFVLVASCVAHTFTHHISEVASLTEHIACCRGLRWSDSHALCQQSEEVCHATAVEEEPSIADPRGHTLETLLLSTPLNFEDSDASDLCGILIASTLSVEAVSSNQIALRVTLLEELNLHTHAVVDILNRVNCVLAVDRCKEQTTCEFNVHQIVDLRELLLHFPYRL